MLNRMMTVMSSPRPETSRRLRAPIGVALFVVLSVQIVGCGFVGVALRQTPWFFRKPKPAPRHDLPRSDDAALSLLWVGHATALVQIGDRFILTDPVFTELVGGLSRRMVLPGLDPSALPGHLTVLVSHRHFDHLSKGSFPLIAARVDTVLTPPGAAADVPRGAYQVAQLGTWKTWEESGLRVTAVPAEHDGGRYLHDKRSHARAYTGYVIEYRGLRVYFAGDTAYRSGLFTEIAERFPTIDLALMPIGPITPIGMMRPHHLDPAQALTATLELHAAQMVPIHFGTYLHSYDRPGEVEARFDEALRARSALQGRAHRLELGERRVLVGATESTATNEKETP